VQQLQAGGWDSIVFEAKHFHVPLSLASKGRATFYVVVCFD
jgi:hypothetical protein